MLALANALVFKISNLHFGPEVGVQSPKHDVPVVANWLHEVRKVVDDLRQVQGQSYPACQMTAGRCPRHCRHSLPRFH